MRLVFNKQNKDIFIAIRDGIKKVETRAATSKYQNIKNGDSLTFSCDGEIFYRKISKVTYFKSIKLMLEVYKPEEINPNIFTNKEIMTMYASFPGYEEKIKEFGLVALLLDEE